MLTCVPLPCAQTSKIDTPNKCKRVLDDAGMGALYNEGTPPGKLRTMAANVMHSRAGIAPVAPTLVTDIEVRAPFEPVFAACTIARASAREPNSSCASRVRRQ